MEFNERQLEVINSTSSKLVVEAPPGSGKTATLVGAIEKYAGDCPMAKITAITFTRKAAAELQSKLAAMNTEVSTIHSWSLRRLQYFSAKYNFTVDLLDDAMIKEILQRICKMRNMFYVNQFQLFNYVMGNFNIDIDEKLKYVFENVRVLYVQFKQKNGLYDFTDLPKYLLDVMEEYDETIDDIQGFFVDELQDIDDTQLQIFQRVHAAKKMYIGDTKQSIYIFRGATQNIFNRLESFDKYSLNINYRSYQEILDFADTFSDITKAMLENDNEQDLLTIAELSTYYNDSINHCIRGEGGKICYITEPNTAVDIVNKKTLSVAPILTNFLDDKHTQILCRYNRQVKKIKSYGFENVSTVHQAKGLEYDNIVLANFNIDCTEEQNIAYVAMTRAKNNLLMIDFNILCHLICKLDLQGTSKLF